MKARIIVLMLVAGMLVVGNQASAQIKSLLKDKAKNALVKGLKRGNEDEQKQKEAEQPQQQQQQPEQQQNSNQGSGNNAMNSFMQQKMMSAMGFNNVKYDIRYDFTSSMDMEINSTDSVGTKADPVLYSTYFDKNSRSFAMEFDSKDKNSNQKQRSLMVFDYKNWAMLILAQKGNEKSGIAMQIAKDSVLEAKQKQGPEAAQQKPEDLSNANMYYKATGRTKTIAGYNCKEYVYETTEGKVEVWGTNDVVYDYSQAYGQMGGMSYFATGGTTYGLGTVLETHYSDKHTKATSDMVTKDIKLSNPKSIDLMGYQIIGMGGQPGNK